MTKDYRLAVYIGRFQPFHNSHLQTLKEALKIADHVLVLIGSHKSPPTVRNPFSAADREDMITRSLSKEEAVRCEFVYIRDNYYNDDVWVTTVQQQVERIAGLIGAENSIALVGHFKDASSSYLNLFPQWDFVPTTVDHTLNATDIREKIFQGAASWRKDVPKEVADYIQERYIDVPSGWKDKDMEIDSPFRKVQKEYEMIQSYKKSWATAPYPPTFVTTDAVVIQNGHVLVIKRKFAPGKGLFAMPGGFIKPSERIADACLRELREETGIKVALPILRSAVVETRVFDHPQRSSRGRTITHASLIRLSGRELPQVRGSDDAAGAQWMSLSELHEREAEFFEDHYQIINAFIGIS